MEKNILLTFVLFFIITGFALEATGQLVQAVESGYEPNEIIVKFHATIADAVREHLEFDTLAHGLRLSTELDELNTRYQAKRIKPLFKNFQLNRQRVNNLQKKKKSLLTKPEKRILKRLSRAPKGAKVPDLDRIYKIEFELEDGQSLEDVVADYNNDPGVEYAELNYIVSVCGVPDDSYYPVQWSLNNIGQDYPISGGQYKSGKSGADISALEAWGVETGSSDVIVAVVDTGVDYTHLDLDDNMWVNEAELNGIYRVDDDENGHVDDIYGYNFIGGHGDPRDDNGHGTHCSGIITGEGNNGQDVAGVSWNSKIMALKFLGANGSGNIYNAITAFNYAVNNGADIISNSWGGGGYMKMMQDVIDYAYSQGVIVIAAAGNDNSTSYFYPAYYDHVISVAATDSNDERAYFSNYGDWVDIAAPGVDILSLRASGTDMYLANSGYVPGDKFVPYGDPDATSYIASGTSMAAPCVSGACALLLAVYPETTVDDVRIALKQSADSIEAGICQSGRLNLYEALVRMVKPKGLIRMDKEAYSCSGLIRIDVMDSNLRGMGTQDVNVTTDGGDFETTTLTEYGTDTGIFIGNIDISAEPVVSHDGVLQVSHGQIISTAYYDPNDGTGNSETIVDIAVVDCEYPEVLDVNITFNKGRSTAIIKIKTDEPTTVQVRCGLLCGEPLDIIGKDSVMSTSHTVKLPSLTVETDYYFVMDVVDAAGNETIADNNEVCYSFTTPEFFGFLVPNVYPTIQSAMDDTIDGDTVWVADGIYTGDGNRDIDFLGKGITVRSVNGPENCIIDCNGTVDEPHRGFYIDNRVSENIVLDGFTIINGYSENLGGGILCDGFPGYGFEMQLAINNCIIRNCQARYNAGIHCAWPFFSPVTISNCVISDNLGSGIYYSGETEINNCVISNNVEHGITGGGGITEIYNCIITDNGGSGISASAYLQISGCTIANNNKSGIKNRGYFTVTDCIIRNNQYSGILNEDGELNLSNSVIRGNYSSTNGGGLSSIGRFEVITVENCVFSDNYAKQNGGGVYSNKGESNDGINKYINCTFIGNIADEYGGGYYGEGWLTEEYLANCIFRGNSASEGLQMGIRDNADVAVAYSNVQGGQEQILVDNSSLSWGQGNIDTDPCFFAYAGDYHQLSNSPCIDAGTNSPTGGLPETDIYGRDRCQDGDGDGNSIADMGAYEFEYDSNTPIIVSYQDFFEFYKFNDQPTSDQYLSIRNCAGGRLNWEIIADCSWLQAVPDSGSSTGEVNEVAIRVDTTNLTHGDYSGKLTIIDANAVNSPRTVLIKLHVGGNLFVPEQYPTIQEAIDAANDGSIIIVADGIYTGTGNKNINFKRKAIRLRSENGPDNCIIDCENDGQGFIFDRNEKTDSVLDGFTIANAYNKTYPHGGGIYIGDSSPVIENCKIINCEAYKLYGGGIYSGGGSPVIRNCFISGNSSRSGGGLYFSGGEIDHCTIVGNKTYYGYGGGIHNSGKATYKNCLIVNNVSAKGGGIYSANSSSIFYNCTIANNSAGNGGGFFRGSWTPIPTLQNCILWNNQPNQIDATSYPINLTYSNIQGGWSGIGNIDADPCFVDAANNDYHLRSEGWYWDSERQRWDYDDVTSRCIDAGNPGTALGDELLTIPDDPNNEWGENLRINMGAYGGTAKASMPPYNWTLLGDLTNDGIVNYLDLTMQLEDWLRSAAEQPGDLNRDGMVNMIDYTIFAEDWL